MLGNYPRGHLLSTRNSPLGDLGRVFTAGMYSYSDRVSQYSIPGVWERPGPVWNQNNLTNTRWRQYGSSVLLPILPDGQWDRILALGGNDKAGTIRNDVHLIDAAASASTVDWVSQQPMPYRRWVFNTVLLPDLRVFVVGGETTSIHEGCSEAPAYTPVIYDMAAPPTQQWSFGLPEQVGPHQITRDYHSTALLLPNGEVFCGGGESRRENPLGACLEGSGPGTPLSPMVPTDYNIFRPAYVTGNRVTIVPPPGPPGSAYDFRYGQTYTISHSVLDGYTINRVVLMRAGSVTHHCDPNQRCVGLNFTFGETPGTLNVMLPSMTAGILPRGYYMMFLVTNEAISPQGVPSLAQWVQVK